VDTGVVDERIETGVSGEPAVGRPGQVETVDLDGVDIEETVDRETDNGKRDY